MNKKNLERKYIVVLTGIVLLVSLVLFSQFRNGESKGEEMNWTFVEEEVIQNEEQEVEKETTVIVDVKGAVLNPGVYQFQEGSRVHHAIDSAGGLLEEADELQLNLAELLQDEMMIYVPFEGDDLVIDPSIGGGNKDGKISLNKADANEFEQLPGIGPSKADAIVAYRDENGSFKSVEELMNVSGIGPKSFEQLKELVTVN